MMKLISIFGLCSILAAVACAAEPTAPRDTTSNTPSSVDEESTDRTDEATNNDEAADIKPAAMKRTATCNCAPGNPICHCM